MNNKETIKALKEWLSKEGNSKAKLSTKLGYSSSTTVTMWLLRGSIPEWQIERVKKIILKKG